MDKKIFILGIEVNTNEDDGDEVSNADDQIGTDLLGDDGRKAAGQRGNGEQQSQQHGPELGIESPESSLQRKHRQRRGGPTRVTEKHRSAVTQYGFFRRSWA